MGGCSPAQGKVSGRVVFDGEPLPAGRVTFRPADPRQNTVSAELDAQGNFTVVLPLGDVLVSVDNREWEPRGPVDTELPKDLKLPPEAKKHFSAVKADRTSDKSPGKYVLIPSKYYGAETSGLRFTVQAGDQKQDIELAR
jgi:hypothetical protein